MRTRLCLLSFVAAGLPLYAAADNVTTYHNSADRHGAYVIPGLTLASASGMHPDSAFRAEVTGHVYAQPLFWHPKGGRAAVIVATESDTVAALDAKTGASIWQARLAEPVALASLPCGNIDPDGITGAPVIDPKAGVLYLDALTQTNVGPHHRVYALSLASGSVQPGWPLDVEGELGKRGVHFDSHVQGERGALQLLKGSLYVGYGGNLGDCGDYRGTVIQIDVSKRTLAASWQTRARGGGIWAQGGVASDGESLFVTTGNTFEADGWSDGEAIIRLEPGLAHSTATADYFTPRNWKSLDNEDADLGGTGAIPFDIGDAKRIIAFGKDGNAYVVDRGNLGGERNALAIAKMSRDTIITAPAVLEAPSAAMIAFINRSGRCGVWNVTMLKVTAASSAPVSVEWCAPFSGGGAPVITTTDGSSSAIVWVVGAEGDNLLHGFNAATGQVVFSGGGTRMEGLHHFQTLIAAEGRLYVAADDKVYAFAWGR